MKLTLTLILTVLLTNCFVLKAQYCREVKANSWQLLFVHLDSLTSIDGTNFCKLKMEKLLLMELNLEKWSNFSNKKTKKLALQFYHK